MKLDAIHKLIDATDWAELQKIRTKNFMQYAVDLETERTISLEIIKKVSGCDKPFTLVLDTPEVKVFKLDGIRGTLHSHPFHVVYKNNKEQWVSSSVVSESLDAAMLTYLGEKYDGINSQFSYFAGKMLFIK